MTAPDEAHHSRVLLYVAMAVLLGAIIIGAYYDASPIFLAVGLIGEIVLGATAHLSTMIERYGVPRSKGQAVH